MGVFMISSKPRGAAQSARKIWMRIAKQSWDQLWTSLSSLVHQSLVQALHRHSAGPLSDWVPAAP